MTGFAELTDIDGSKVEAQTPDGTRVATPSQAPPSSAAPAAATPTPAAGAGASGQGGTATPRTASYAGAVKTAPTEWHLEFTYEGNEVVPDDTVYGIVHKNQAKSAAGATGTLPGSMGVFGATAVFKYKKVPGPLPTGEWQLFFEHLKI